MKKTLMITSATVLLLGACSEVKKVDEMHDATVKMADTTGKMDNTMGEMNKTTGDMSKTTGEMNETTTEMNQTTNEMNQKMASLEQKTADVSTMTNELYDALRQGNALQLRREAYRDILKAPTLFKKISEATKYFMSFEFQLWNMQGQDETDGKRDILAQQAAKEFFMEIEELAPRDGSVNPAAAPNPDNIDSESNREASFLSMAAGMDQINRKEEDAIAAVPGTQIMSMYTMVEAALLAPRNQPQTGASREIMAHEAKAIQLLQARLNIFPLIFVDSITHLANKNVLQKAKMAFVGWDFDMDTLNATQLEYLQTEVLQHAIDAKNLLKKIGQQPVLDKNVVRLLNKMKVITTGSKGPAIVAQQTKLIGLVREIQK